MVDYLKISLLQSTTECVSEKKLENRLISGEVMGKRWCIVFLTHGVYCLLVYIVCFPTYPFFTFSVVANDNAPGVHRESKKQDTKLLPITSPNINRFSKFFHC